MSQRIVFVRYGRAPIYEGGPKETDYHPGRHRYAINEYIIRATGLGWFAVQRSRGESGTEICMEQREPGHDCPQP